MNNDNFAPCWNCGKENKKQPCGYYLCDCKSYDGSGILWYLPMEVYNWRRMKINKLFLDDEEK